MPSSFATSGTQRLNIGTLVKKITQMTKRETKSDIIFQGRYLL